MYLQSSASDMNPVRSQRKTVIRLNISCFTFVNFPMPSFEIPAVDFSLSEKIL